MKLPIFFALLITVPVFAQIQSQSPSVHMSPMNPIFVNDAQIQQRQQQEQDYKNQLRLLEEQRILETQKQNNLIMEQQNQIQQQKDEIGELHGQLNDQKTEIEGLEQDKSTLQNMQPSQKNLDR